MGIPVVCNSGVGDVDSIINETGAGTLVKDFDIASYDEAVTQICAGGFPSPEAIRAQAVERFSLSGGIEKYAGVYRRLILNAASPQ